MTRMIERWFPCAEVSDASRVGWGSGNVEASLWVWFAKRPTAQAKAAVLTSLLPWPDDKREQQGLQEAVKAVLTADTPAKVRALHTRGGAMSTIRSALKAAHPLGARILDPFSGRAMIPLEAGRLGARAEGIEYSPFAALGGALLAEIPFRDWSTEPRLPYQATTGQSEFTDSRLVGDVETFLVEVGNRFTASMAEFYPTHKGAFPWGYLWASTLPCDECGNRFPLVGELWLRLPRKRTKKRPADSGQSFDIEVDRATGEFQAIVHEEDPAGSPTRVFVSKSRYASSGRVAVCSFCHHVHPKAVHTRLSAEGLRRDSLLVAADIAEDGSKVFREPTEEEHEAAVRASRALAHEKPIGPLTVRPDERIPPGNTWTIKPVNYGDATYGDLMSDRQTLGMARLARIINEMSEECLATGSSPDYVRSLAGYATAAMMRKVRRCSRGSRLELGAQKVGDIFVAQAGIMHSYDWFESGLSDGPGSWESLARKTITCLRAVISRAEAVPAIVQRGSATMLPYRDGEMTAIVTDPPYYDMIEYSDCSDLFYVWAKRSMFTADSSLAMTMHPDGVQEKDEEIIVKRGGKPVGDHRTLQHYEHTMSRAYAEMRRVVADDGVVTIVFGHGDVDVWHRMLRALGDAGLVATASWPAKTEAGGASAGALNIVTTVTMACRPAPDGRMPGSQAMVDNRIRAEVRERIRMWERAGLARSDMLMASVGPAMEIVGRYSSVHDNTGEHVGLLHFLAVARKAVKEVVLSKIDSVPLERFDARTQFALWWVDLHRRQRTAKSELQWQGLTDGLAIEDLASLVAPDSKGCRFVLSNEVRGAIRPRSSVVDVALAMARAWTEGGIDDVATVLADAEREGDDELVWATIGFLVAKLAEGDPDALTWTALTRARREVEMATRSTQTSPVGHSGKSEAEDMTIPLF